MRTTPVINGFGPEDDAATADVDESVESVNNAMDVDTLSYAMVDNKDDERGIAATLGDTSTSTTTGTNLRNGGMTITVTSRILSGPYMMMTLTGDDQANVIEGGRGGDMLRRRS